MKKENVEQLLKNKDLSYLLHKKVSVNKILDRVNYEEELRQLQEELVKLQLDVIKNKRKVIILFEGRDAAGKGGSIRRFTHYLNPRHSRVVALSKPTGAEKGQWYFQRYAAQLPNPGEIVFFDRSWYNRAVVEPVNGFCSKDQYKRFIKQVNWFEHMLVEDGIEVIKFWFSVSKEEQSKRFDERKNNPLKQWKLSPVDLKAQDLWDEYTKYKNNMFLKTHSTFSPWINIKGDNKKKARLESIRYVLSLLDYEEKENSKVSLMTDSKVVSPANLK